MGVIANEHDDTRPSRASGEERGASARSTASEGRARTCVGCGERVEVTARGSALVRLILGPGGEIAVDSAGGGFGRGAHVHPRPDCLAKAVQRGLARAAKGRVHSIRSEHDAEELLPLTAETLAAAIKASMDRRVQGLLVAAIRSRNAAIGADAVKSACERGEAALVLVACDAAAAAELSQVRKAVAEGRAVAWGTKVSLGNLAGGSGNEGTRTSGVGVIALTSPRIAAAVRAAVHTGDECTGRASARRGLGPHAAPSDERGRGSAGKNSGLAAGAAAKSRVVG
jgi:predicted RNA-binding protein YlxR (DUF448 family)